jgi:hypothetical protein
VLLGLSATRSFFPALAFFPLKKAPHPKLLNFFLAKEQMKNLLTQYMRTHEISFAETSGQKTGIKEAENFDEDGKTDSLDGRSSESSATEKCLGHQGLLDFEWPDDLIATVRHFQRSTVSPIKPRLYSKKHRGFQPESRAARTAWKGKQTLRPSMRCPEPQQLEQAQPESSFG